MLLIDRDYQGRLQKKTQGEEFFWKPFLAKR